jgi:hypothetical protein
MPKIKAKTLDIVADGKVINVKTPDKLNFEMNKALQDPEKFKRFAADPRSFAKEYRLEIDQDISRQLSQKLKGIDSIDALGRIRGRGGEVEATVWAVAEGAYSVASTKIAVAF